MKIKGIEAYSIDHIHGNCIFSKDGTVSMVYELELPRKNSLSKDDFDLRCNELDKAFRFFPVNTIVHKQDIVINEAFKGSNIARNSFLGNDQKKHFGGREFISHRCLLIYSMKGIHTLENAYQSNPLKYKEALHSKDLEKLDYFDSNVQRSINVINGIKDTRVLKLEEKQVRELLTEILNGFESTGFYDLDFSNQSFGDGTKFKMVAINKSEYLPTTFSNVRLTDKSTEYSPVYEGFFDGLNEVMPFNHIVNQMIFFAGKENIIKTLEESRKEYGKVQTYNDTFKATYNALENVVSDVTKSEQDLVYTHCNVLVFDKNDRKLYSHFRQITGYLDSLGVKYYVPQKAVLQNAFLGSIMGRQQMLHKDFRFIAPLIQAVSLFTHSTISKDDPQGVYFNDAVTQQPRVVDLWDEKNVYMNARNGIICAETGGGKSVTCLSFITQFLEKGINVAVAEFGRSFEFITRLFPDISQHVVLQQDTPLGINPFDLQGASEASIEKKGYLAEIIMKTWRVVQYMEDTHYLVSLDKIINHYYESVKQDHNYDSFYHFVIKGGNKMLYLLDIEQYFDLDSFKHSCSQFISGGKYENVFKVDHSLTNHITEKQLVVFELTEIKKDPFLVTLVLLILQETIDTNILADKSKKGALIFDEFAETAVIRDMYTNQDVLQTVSVLYQKIRKENGAVYIIVQDLSQLPENNFTKSIYANSQIFMMLPSSRAGYEEVKSVLKLTDSEASEMMSIQNNYNAIYPYGMFWLKRGEHKTVLKNELSPYAYYAFQTKGEIWQALSDDYINTKSLELSIKNYANQTS